MSRNKSARKRKKEAAGQRKERSQSHWQWHRIPKTIYLLLSICATLLAFAVVVPRLVVTTIESNDPDNPLSSRFLITNTGFIPLTKVGIGVHPQEVTVGDGGIIAPPRQVGDEASTIAKPEWQGITLKMDDNITISLSDIFGPPGPFRLGADPHQFKSADLSVIVQYQPWILPIHLTKEFRIKSHPEANGKFVWNVTP